jgi:transcriptional regulator with XRE-family HTH domain
MSNVSQIDGSVVRMRREAQGWAINDIAVKACLSVKQIRQIEEGGLSSFYSEKVKLTAAKKVAALLQLSEAQLFGQAPLYPPQAEEESFLFDSTTEPFRMVSVDTPPGPAAVESTGVHLSRSEPLHFLAQPPEVEVAASPADQANSEPDVVDSVSAPAVPVQEPKDETAPTPGPSGNYFLKILVLFLVAIAVAALLRPQTLEPSPVVPEAASGQNMTSTEAVPPADGVAPPEAGAELPAEAAKSSAEAKPAALAEPLPLNAPVKDSPAAANATSNAAGSER